VLQKGSDGQTDQAIEPLPCGTNISSSNVFICCFCWVTS